MSPTEMMLLEALTRFGTHRDDLNARLTTLLKNWQQGQDRHDTALANELDAMDRVFRQTLTGLADSQSAMMASVQNLTEAHGVLELTGRNDRRAGSAWRALARGLPSQLVAAVPRRRSIMRAARSPASNSRNGLGL